MAESTSKSHHDINLEQEQKQKLKYLDFIQVTAAKAITCLANLYSFAKDNSGPVKPAVDSIESAVLSVAGPVYHKFHTVPSDILTFLDRKVGGLMNQVPAVARSAAGEVQRAGVVGTARDVLVRYEPVAEQYAVAAWRSLNRLPLFPAAAQVVVPAAAHLSDKYNRAVGVAAERGYAVAGYIPLVPTKRIARVFGGGSKSGKKME